MMDWFERDEDWKTMAPLLFNLVRWKTAPEEVKWVIDELGLEEGAKVLDLCCGVGRHSLQLARRGLTVTGVDRTALYLRTIAMTAEEDELELELVQEDMRTFCRPGAFDCAINLYTSFGYFEDPEDDRKVARNLAESLRPGGALVMDLMPKEVMARTFERRFWTTHQEVLLLEERTLSQDWSWIRNRWIIIQPDGKRTQIDFGLRLYSASELRALLLSSGFAEVTCYGDWDKRPFDQQAERLLLVARTCEKPAQG
jgi:SAM-dependent methyltransferase